MRIRQFVLAVGLAAAALPAAAQTSKLEPTTHASPPPPALAKAVAAQLASEGVRVTVKDVTLEFWWVASLPLSGEGPPTWQGVAEGSLVGAVQMSGDFRDIRGRVIKPGVYTLRYGIQPANGDHLGVSPYRDFLLLSPAAVDTDPAPRGHDGTIELSKQAIGGSHPGVWSIDPPVARSEPLQLHQTELGHTSVIMAVPVTRAGKPTGSLRFGLVLVGRIEA